MKIHVAGGKCEHGRNCFCIDDEENTFLLDCGIMADDKKNPYPRLSNDEISRLKVIFISHSHLDHFGALKWIFSQGFLGIVAATKETFENIAFEIPNKIFLEEWNSLEDKNRFGIKIEYGKTGHCSGSVWLKLNFHNQNKNKSRTIFYSGDYVEQTQVYKCQKIRNQKSDFAIIDCAYGKKNFSYKKQCKKIVRTVQKNLKKSKLILFPVPKNGRGIELIFLLNEKLKNKNKIFFADQNLSKVLDELNKNPKNEWYKISSSKIQNNVKPLTKDSDAENLKGICFVSDPQLKNENSILLSNKILASNGKIIFTGTVEKQTQAQYLLDSRLAKKIIYPVHQSNKDYKNLVKKNKFTKSIKFHTPEDSCTTTIFEV